MAIEICLVSFRLLYPSSWSKKHLRQGSGSKTFGTDVGEETAIGFSRLHGGTATGFWPTPLHQLKCHIDS